MTIRDRLKRDIVKYFKWCVNNSMYLKEIVDNIHNEKYFDNLLLNIKKTDMVIYYKDFELRIDDNLFKIFTLLYGGTGYGIAFKYSSFKNTFIRSMISSIYTMYDDYLRIYINNRIEQLCNSDIKQIYNVMNDNVFQK